MDVAAYVQDLAIDSYGCVLAILIRTYIVIEELLSLCSYLLLRRFKLNSVFNVLVIGVVCLKLIF